MSNKDYYKVLGVSREAGTKDIKKAYLNLAKKYHPDRNRDDADSEKKFKEVSHAYDILKDDQKKAAYDRMGHDAFQQGGSSGQGAGGSRGGFGADAGGHDMNDIFGDFFSDFMGGGNQRTQRSSRVRGSDLKYNVSISLEDAFKGIDKKINFPTEVTCSPCSGRGSKSTSGVSTCPQCAGAGVVRIQQGFFAVQQACSNCAGAGQIIKNPCNTCHGTGRTSKQKQLIVNIPSGIETSTRIRIVGEGEAGMRGGSAGDLYVVINIKRHDIYQVEGSHLHCKLPLSFTKAALGGEIEIPTIDGSSISLKIPAGTETGDKLRLRGKGMSQVRSSVRGDLFTHAFVQTPKKLNKKQKELLEELDKELGDADTNLKDEGFFSRMKNMWS